MTDTLIFIEKILKDVAISQAKAEARLAKIDAQQAKIDARQAKNDEQIAKNDEQIAKNAAQQAKTDAQLAKTDAQLAKTDAQLAKTDAQLAKTDLQLSDVALELKKTMRILSGVGINLGDTTEFFFYNALAEKMEFGGIRYDYITKNIHAHKGKIQGEFDIIMVNGKHVALIETKYKLHPNDLVELKEKQLPICRQLMPHYANCALHLGVASHFVSDEVIEKAKKEGIGVLRPDGKALEMVSPPLSSY